MAIHDLEHPQDPKKEKQVSVIYNLNKYKLKDTGPRSTENW